MGELAAAEHVDLVLEVGAHGLAERRPAGDAVGVGVVVADHVVLGRLRGSLDRQVALRGKGQRIQLGAAELAIEQRRFVGEVSEGLGADEWIVLRRRCEGSWGEFTALP